MGNVERELRKGSQPFARALAAAMSDDLPVPIREVMDPAQTPSAFLPFLAVHDGVRFWFSDWPVARKRTVIANGPTDAALVGTRPATHRYLGYVDGTVLDVVSYPTRFVLGRARIGPTPVGHPPWLARHLVKVDTATPSHGFVFARAVLGRARMKTPPTEKFARAMAALRVAKTPETEYLVDFGHHRPLLLSDAPPLDGSLSLGAYVPRSRL